MWPAPSAGKVTWIKPRVMWALIDWQKNRGSHLQTAQWTTPLNLPLIIALMSFIEPPCWFNSVTTRCFICKSKKQVNIQKSKRQAPFSFFNIWIRWINVEPASSLVAHQSHRSTPPLPHPPSQFKSRQTIERTIARFAFALFCIATLSNWSNEIGMNDRLSNWKDQNAHTVKIRDNWNR